jgi:hypothetical protein
MKFCRGFSLDREIYHGAWHKTARTFQPAANLVFPRSLNKPKKQIRHVRMIFCYTVQMFSQEKAGFYNA